MTTTQQTEAGRPSNAIGLANQLNDLLHDWTVACLAADELRRLVAENQRQRADLERKSEAIQRLWAERDQLRAQVEQMQGGEPVTLTDFDAIPDEVIDTAQDKSGMYRVELMRAWDAIIAALREKEKS